MTPMERYAVRKKIGSGSFGSVYIADDKSNPGLVVVIKKVELGGLDEKDRRQATAEAVMLKMLKHQNIVGYRDAFMVDDTLNIVMEFCEAGDLASHIKKRKKSGEPFAEAEVLDYFA